MSPITERLKDEVDQFPAIEDHPYTLFFDSLAAIERLQARVAELEAATWTREQALIDVEKERERQDEKWGGANHDDDHTPDFWVQLIKNYAGWAQVMAGMDSPHKYRKRMIQVAALAVAAAGGMDRQLSAAQKQEQGQ